MAMKWTFEPNVFSCGLYQQFIIGSQIKLEHLTMDNRMFCFDICTLFQTVFFLNGRHNYCTFHHYLVESEIVFVSIMRDHFECKST